MSARPLASRPAERRATPRGPMEVRWLGRLDWRAAHALQRQVLADRIAGRVPDTLLVVEHEPVYTLGRRRGAAANVLAAGGVPVVEAERGGDVTFHGPGQVVVYPIVDLAPDRMDLHRHLRTLEEAVIRTCARWGLAAGRDPRNSGAWIGGRKVAAVGIACRRWVTWHGLALNVDPDLAAFARIRPCGLEPDTVTSMARELGSPPPLEAVAQALVDQLVALLGAPARPARQGAAEGVGA